MKTNLADTATTRRPGRPARFYTWDAPGTCGVTSDRSEATEHVRQALEAAPAGTLGKVRCVTVNPSGRIEYLDLGRPAEARMAAGGALIWSES